MKLVDEPQKVQKIAINYDRTAKVVDVRALKNSIWSLLERESKNVTTTDEDLNESDSEPSHDCVSFQNVVGRLDETVPARALPDVSVALSFICLLHLANEKGLQIVGNQSMDELRVFNVRN